jgi:hypothetical protein
MRVVADARALGRFVRGLRSFLRWRITPEEARQIVRQNIARRGENLLETLERNVFANRRSPYLALLRRADVGLEDIRRMVAGDGLEASLETLHGAGVYVTFEEFKGRRPIVRDGLELPVTARDFDNPLAARSFAGRTSGSTGPATRTALDLDHLIDQVPAKALEADAFGMWSAPMALWRAVPPSPTGLRNALLSCPMGNPPRRWFTPVTARQLRAPLRTRLAGELVLTTAALCGTPFPRAELLRLDLADVLAEWAADMLRRHGRCLIRSFISMAMRICLAAKERGIDLTGTGFMAGGEPATEVKVRIITQAGAVLAPSYATTEIGTIGVGCARPAEANDVHLAADLVAVFTRPREVQGLAAPVDAFYVTTLRPHVPKMALNLEMDDCGVIDRRACGCPLGDAGYGVHLRSMRSYGKLTGEGVTLSAEQALRVLEEVLPARFGGSPFDYQFAEEEDERGFTRLILLVSPRIDLPDEQAAVEVALRGLRETDRAGAYAAAFWQQAGSLSVRRAEPKANLGGKFAALYVTGRGEGPGVVDTRPAGR